MIEYIYFVKCMDCEDEPFDFFDEAKEFALSKLGKKPEIHQTEVVRNDFGECIDSKDYGKVWSWEEVMQDIPGDTEVSIFTKGDFDKYADGYNPDNDPEFDDRDITFETDCARSEVSEELHYENHYDVCSNCGAHVDSQDITYENWEDRWVRYTCPDCGNTFDRSMYGVTGSVDEQITRKPVPDDMTIDGLVEAMEENEEIIECKRCHELFPKEDCLYELNIGYLCPICIMDLDAAGEELEFRPREIPEKVVDEEPLEEAKNESSVKYDIFDDSVSFYYDGLEATVQYNQTDADSWDEKEFSSDNFEYSVSMEDFAEEVWNYCIDDESYKEFQDRYDELYEDDKAWFKFVNDNTEELMRRYSKQLFDQFESDAEERYQKEVWDEWNNRHLESVETEKEPDVSLLETLEESEDYKKRLMMCPECGVYSFDQETGICINCGFIAFD